METTIMENQMEKKMEMKWKLGLSGAEDLMVQDPDPGFRVCCQCSGLCNCQSLFKGLFELPYSRTLQATYDTNLGYCGFDFCG